MSTFQFETITAAQALAIGGQDSVTFASGSGQQATLLYNLDGNGGVISETVISGGHSVVFGAGLFELSQARHAAFPDGSLLVAGGAGNDALWYGPVGSGMFGGPGADTINGDGYDVLQGNAGNDSLMGGSGPDTIYGGQGDDIIHTEPPGNAGNNGPLANFAQGNMGADTIYGGTGPDTLLGGKGDDVIYDVASAQGVSGGNFLNGNLGNDVISFSDGNNTVFGEDGNDTLQAQGQDYGSNLVYGGDGDDWIGGGLGSAYLDGGAGNDQVYFGDEFIPSAGATLIGGSGDDTLGAASGELSLSGGDGNDSLSAGGSGFATLDGGAGDDTLSDQFTGQTISLYGGPGADRFEIGFSRAGTAAYHARIMDWDPTDRLGFQLAGGAPLVVSPAAYGETAASDFADAQSRVTQLFSASQFRVVAVQVSDSVFVFADLNPITHAQSFVEIVGASLSDFDQGRLI